MSSPQNKILKPFNPSLFHFPQNIVLSLEDRDAEELILVLRGYYQLLANRELEIVRQKTPFSQQIGKFIA